MTCCSHFSVILEDRHAAAFQFLVWHIFLSIHPNWDRLLLFGSRFSRWSLHFSCYQVPQGLSCLCCSPVLSCPCWCNAMLMNFVSVSAQMNKRKQSHFPRIDSLGRQLSGLSKQHTCRIMSCEVDFTSTTVPIKGALHSLTGHQPYSQTRLRLQQLKLRCSIWCLPCAQGHSGTGFVEEKCPASKEKPLSA